MAQARGSTSGRSASRSAWVAGITPFNFPAMIPMWMFGPALAAGNAFILKPSEQNPSVPVRLAELLAEAGLPDGVFSVVHGGKAAVDALLDHADVKAVSFVGSSDVAAQVYARGAANGKRVQAMGGAKNHAIVMPDADLDHAVEEVIGAAFGSAGERCMALPVVVPVGDATAFALRERLVAAGDQAQGRRSDRSRRRLRTCHLPRASRAHRKPYPGRRKRRRELVVDGRGLALQGHEGGYFLGPTLFDRVTPDMRSYQQEIFGPVLQIVRAASLEEGISLASEHPYGNGVAIFTGDGAAAREFADRVEIGMWGLTCRSRCPLPITASGAGSRSAFGDHNQYGMDGIRFFSRTKVVTQRWPRPVRRRPRQCLPHSHIELTGADECASAVPKEIKTHEYRVGLMPFAVREYVAAGHMVVVEQGAGAGVGAADADYVKAGAVIAPEAADIFAAADMIVKVKEPLASEWSQLREGQILFTYLHLAPDRAQADGLLASGGDRCRLRDRDRCEGSLAAARADERGRGPAFDRSGRGGAQEAKWRAGSPARRRAGSSAGARADPGRWRGRHSCRSHGGRPSVPRSR